MPSQSKFLQNAEKILRKYPGSFKALEEFEKTGKVITKKRLNFTIDRVIAKEFRDYCKANNLNMSKIVEDFIRKTLKNKF